MEKTMNRLFTAGCLCVFFLLFFLLLFGRYGERLIALLPKPAPEESVTESPATVNWEERFPFADTRPENARSLVLTSSEERLLSRLDYYHSVLGNIGTVFGKTIWKERELSVLGVAVRSRLSDCSQLRDYVRLDNGWWIVLNEVKPTVENQESLLADYALLQRSLSGEGIPFLYCYTPRKTCSVEGGAPKGLTDYTNESIDMDLQILDRLGTNTLDLREKLHEDKLEHYSLFFKTDHHWTPEAGFWAAETIEDELTDRFGLRIRKPSDFGEFRSVTCENAMFGSYGGTVTHYAASSEDFTVLLPKFETRFRLEIPDGGTDRIGSFEELFIDFDGLAQDMEVGGYYAYSRMLDGNRPYERITNLLNPDGPRLLVIKDSFGNAPAMYLALSCSELVLIDARPSDRGNFNGSLLTCIREFRPDAVLTVQNTPQKITLYK